MSVSFPQRCSGAAVCVRRFHVIALCLVALACSWSFPRAMAQSDSSAQSFSPVPAMAPDSAQVLPSGGFPGGAARADFSTLMNLIQQTVDPDSWLANGGVSTMLPYPSGVYVDPQGHMQRVRSAEQLSAEDLFSRNSDPALRHPWKNASPLRVVSLKSLDRALQAARYQGVNPSQELLQLAGLSRIQYVKVDVGNEDILLAGPAGDSVFGFELQDAAVVAALVKLGTVPWGCSIDPSDQGLLAAQQFLQSRGVVSRLARNPRMVVEQMQDKIGPHNVRVFGMDANTGTAIALVDADEHMKQVGFGTVDTVPAINSYFDFLDQQGNVSQQSLIRWWFAYNDEPIMTSSAGNVFQIPDQCVAVMSEQQWVSQQGRVPTGNQDPAADAFARSMSQMLPELRRTHASYARLNAVFELGLALQLAIESTGQPSLEAWLPELCRLGKMASVENPTPRTVEGLTTWHKMKDGTVVAVVSGGVKVDASQTASRKKWKESKFLASSVVPTPPEIPRAGHASWWWENGR